MGLSSASPSALDAGTFFAWLLTRAWPAVAAGAAFFGARVRGTFCAQSLLLPPSVIAGDAFPRAAPEVFALAAPALSAVLALRWLLDDGFRDLGRGGFFAAALAGDADADDPGLDALRGAPGLLASVPSALLPAEEDTLLLECLLPPGEGRAPVELRGSLMCWRVRSKHFMICVVTLQTTSDAAAKHRHSRDQIGGAWRTCTRNTHARFLCM